MTQTSPEDSSKNNSHMEEPLETAEKVRTGEYFREARIMYDLAVHNPMAERYLYVTITIISIVIFLVALSAAQGLYPLNTVVPVIYSINDVVEDVPSIRPLTKNQKDDPSEALLMFFIQHYVEVREEYKISTFDRDVNSVKSQSSEEVFKEFEQLIDPRNPDSPIELYQRHSRRKINVLSFRRNADTMEVFFEATVENRNESNKSHWRANITFQFSGIELDEKTDMVKPVKFVVTKYHSKRLQDVK